MWADVCARQQEGAAAAEFRGAWHADGLPDAAALVFSTFELLFPDTFQRILPVHKHKVVPPLHPSTQSNRHAELKQSWAGMVLSRHRCVAPGLSAHLSRLGWLATRFSGMAQNAGQVWLRVMGTMQEVDLLLQKWDVAWAALASAESEYERSKKQIRPRHRLGRRLCPGA